MFSLLPRVHSLETNQASREEVELRHNPQCALSMFRSTCSSSTWTKHWNLHQSFRPTPSLPSDARTNSTPDSSVDSVRCSLAKARPTLVYSFLCRARKLAIGSHFLSIQLVEEGLQVRSHVGECKLGKVSL